MTIFIQNVSCAHISVPCQTHRGRPVLYYLVYARTVMFHVHLHARLRKVDTALPLRLAHMNRIDYSCEHVL
jgi:hypothetical protein